MVATYRDQHGNTVQVHQRAGRRALERLGYTLLEGDEHDDANDPGLPPAPVPPAASTPNVTDIVERGDVSGSAVSETNPLGGVKLTPDAEPTGAPAPWVGQVEGGLLRATPEQLGEAALTAGVAEGDVDDYLAIVADTATLAGVPQNEVAVWLNAAFEHDYVTNELRNQFADWGLPISQWLASELDVDLDALQTLITDKQVSAGSLLQALERNVTGASEHAAKSEAPDEKPEPVAPAEEKPKRRSPRRGKAAAADE